MTRLASPLLPFPFQYYSAVFLLIVAIFDNNNNNNNNNNGGGLEAVSAFTSPPTINRVDDVAVKSNWLRQTADDGNGNGNDDDDGVGFESCDGDGFLGCFTAVDRRSLLVAAVGSCVATVVTTTIAPSPALAIKQKNEALCGTGFFEHIYEYKCTSIGDIEDEGQSKTMSQTQSGLTDGLMGKLGLESGDSTFSTEVSYGDSSKAKAKKEAISAGAKSD